MLSKRAQHLLPSLYDHNPMISMQFGFLMDNQTNVFWALNETCVINHFYDYAYLKRQWILEMISSRVLGWTGIRKDVSFGLACSLWWIMDLFVMESPSSKNNRKNYRYRSIASFLSILIRGEALYWKDFEGGETLVKLVWVNIVKVSGDQNIDLVFSISL